MERVCSDKGYKLVNTFNSVLAHSIIGAAESALLKTLMAAIW